MRAKPVRSADLYNDSVQNYAVVVDMLPTSRTVLQLRAYSARYDENSRLDSLGAPAPPAFANLNQRYKRLDGTLSHSFGSRNLVQGGYEWAQDNYSGANRLVGDNEGRQITSNDVWLQDKFQLTRFATLDIGGRITSNSLFGTWAVPKVGLVVRLSDHWTARGAYGNGFRSPDLGQLYYRFANPASFYQVIGNPHLQPETSRSFSTGVDFRARRFRGSISLFRNDVRNLIDSVNIGTPRTAEQLAALLNHYGIPFSFNPLLNRQTFVYQNFGRIYTAVSNSMPNTRSPGNSVSQAPTPSWTHVTRVRASAFRSAINIRDSCGPSTQMPASVCWPTFVEPSSAIGSSIPPPGHEPLDTTSGISIYPKTCLTERRRTLRSTTLPIAATRS